MKSGAFMPAGTTLALLMAFFSVPVTSGFAPLLKPMWQSLICTNEKSSTFPTPVPPPFIVCASSFEAGTPPTIDHSNPVPAHAMHPRKLRRSIPSPAGFAAAGLSCTTSSSLNRFISTPSVLIAYTAQNWRGARLFHPCKKSRGIIRQFFASLVEEPANGAFISRTPQKHGINLPHLCLRRYGIPDFSSALRFHHAFRYHPFRYHP